MDFVHLHNHTDYSLFDGMIKLDNLIDTAIFYKMPAVAITDHGNMFGALKFYKKCREKGIKPIIGCEVYIADEGVSEHHLLLLAKNTVGYQNLMKLVSAGYTEGFCCNPRIDKELLASHTDGLIGMSACLKGEIPSLLLAGKIYAVEEAAQFYNNVFEDGDFYIEIMDNGTESQADANRLLVKFGKRLSIPIVATNNSHYIKPEDARSREVLKCINTKSIMKNKDRLNLQTGELYFKSPREMAKSFRDYDDALRNTVEIAEKCNLQIEFGKSFLPIFEPLEALPQKQYLEKLVMEGFEKRFAALTEVSEVKEELSAKKQEYSDRVRMELDVIEKHGATGYFLLIWDIINHAKKNRIPAGPGRGSTTGSLTSYCLGISDIDPIRYGLIFERFLNPNENSMPDIDIDFCETRREEMFAYLKNKYGSENVGHISTFITMKAKGVVRDVGRVLGMSYDEVDTIAKLIPNELNITLKRALEIEPRLKILIKAKENIKDLFEIAMKLEGLNRQISSHASGIVISPEPLVNVIPLALCIDQEQGNQKNDEKNNIESLTQYGIKDIESIGLLNLDFLGLKVLTVLHKAVTLIKKTRGIDLQLVLIPLDDADVYIFLSEGNTTGIFQLESFGMRDLLRKIKPSVFEDIAALIAIYRPGPLESGIVDDFIEVKHGRKQPKYEHPLLADILKETYGVILYQEQIMKIANVLSGFSLAEANIFRKTLAKKDPAPISAQANKFVDGAVAKGIRKEVAQSIFNLLEKASGYSFNRSHSVAYAMLTYRTAYLKVHYPQEFMESLTRQDK
ncbi:MAG: DNA polymerase III subunit alpha [Candidatus Schekmanbacteria bacterium]|nr:DNA polymerase III subunit alpha [Candidatus Schekmanbacteria bacterium]